MCEPCLDPNINKSIAIRKNYKTTEKNLNTDCIADIKELLLIF